MNGDDIYRDGRYQEGNPTWHAEDSLWKASHIYSMMDSNGIAAESVCEVGCGAGEILRKLQEMMKELWNATKR